MTHPIPPGTRDVLPDEMRELRAITERMRPEIARISRISSGSTSRVPRGIFTPIPPAP